MVVTDFSVIISQADVCATCGGFLHQGVPGTLGVKGEKGGRGDPGSLVRERPKY